MHPRKQVGARQGKATRQTNRPPNRYLASFFEMLEPRQVLADMTLSPGLIHENSPIGTVVGTLSATADASPTPAMEFVAVRDAGNTADSRIGTDGTSGYGSVGYDFSIGKYEVTVSQYVEFLNSCAKTDSYGLYDSRMSRAISRGGPAGLYAYTTQPHADNKPINWVSFFDAARFANWMNNGKKPEATESGAYELNGFNPTHVTRNANATYWIPSEDEWYKAAYYNATVADYWLYPTQSNDTPTKTEYNAVGNGLAGVTDNSANYGRSGLIQATVTDVGTNGVPSRYGAFDLGGNVQEWNDTELTAVSNGFAYYSRGIRGADYLNSQYYLRATERDGDAPATFADMNIGFRLASHADTGSASFTYAFVTGVGDTDNASFTIDGNQLKAAASFDYEKTPVLAVRIRATDLSGVAIERPLIVTVGNVKETPTDISLTSTTLGENKPSGTLVGTFLTSAPDVGETFTYALASGAGDIDNAAFTTVGSELRTTTSFNYEARSTLSIRVRSTNSGGLFTEKVFSISVTNVNEAPLSIELTSPSAPENQPSGTIVGMLSATDTDAVSSFTYALVAGEGSSGNASFRIDGSTLKTTAALDYESTNAYAIRVRATDQDGLWVDKQFVIVVTNVNEVPNDIVLSSTHIAENQSAGSAIGLLGTVSPDSEVTFTYTLVAGDGSADNSAFTIVGTALQAAAPFNFEAKSNYAVRVRSTDQHGLWLEKAFTITVTDVREGLAIDHIDPPAQMLYRSGDTLRFEMVLTRPVTVAGKPEADLQVGIARNKVIYQSGSGTNRLVFTYATKAGDNASTGIALGKTLRLPTGASIRLDSTNLPLGLPPVDTSGVRVDTTAPVVSQMNGPPAGIYKAGNVLWFTASMSEATIVSGVPTLPLVIGSTIRQATYNAGKSTPTSLVFGYVVQAGENDTNGITIGNALALSKASSITDPAGNAASVSIKVPGLATVLVDTATPTVTGVTSPAAKTYRAGDVIDFKLAFNEAVIVTGSPILPVTIGETVRNAAFIGIASGSGNKTLVFRTSPLNGDLDVDGVAVSGQMVLDDALIADSAGNAFAGAVPAVDTRKILVDAVAPGIVSVTAPALNTTATTLTIRVTFSEAVFVTGKPTVGFQLGGSNRTLTFASGSGSTTLVFSYTVNKKTDNMSLPISLGSAITMKGATIKDRVGNGVASATLPKPT